MRTDNDKPERLPIAPLIAVPDVAVSHAPFDNFVSTVMGRLVSHSIREVSAFVKPSSENAFSYVPVRKYFAISGIDFNQDANESP